MATVHLSFTDNATDETGFVIERSTTSSSAGFSILNTIGARLGTGTVTYNDNTALNNKDYWYRIKAVNGLGDSAYSNVAHIFLVGPFDANDLPGLLRWYKPDPIAVSDLAALPSFPDSSPANVPAVQATGSKQPIFHSAGGPNNKRHITFDGVDDVMAFTQVSNVRTAYVVVKHATGAGSNPSMLGDATIFPYPGNTAELLFSNAAGLSVLWGGGQLYVNGILTSPAFAIKPTVYTVYTLVGSFDAIVSLLMSDRNVYFWAGDLVEAILYSAIHTKAERHLAEDYLGAASRYSFSLAVQSQPPANVEFLFSGNSILATGNIQNLIFVALNSTHENYTWAAGGRDTATMNALAPSQEDVGFDFSFVHDFNVLIAWEITNDLASTDLSGTTTAAAASAAYSRIAAYYSNRKAAHPTLKVIAVTCAPRNSHFFLGGGANPSMSPALFETMRLLVNTAIRNNWTDYADAVADIGGDAALGAWFTDRVGNVLITNGGSGYSSNFAVSFSGGGGSGAAGTAQVVSGAVDSVLITNHGSGYTSAPAASFAAGSGSGAAGTAQLGANDLALYGDGTHPTALGEQKMAEIFIAAIGSLDLGA